MEHPIFVLKRIPKRWTKYQLLTLAPPLVCLFFLLCLNGSGVIPQAQGVSFYLLLIPFGLLWVLTYLFIYRKIHNIAVYHDRLVEAGWRGKEHVIYLSSVDSVRKNWLGEIVLKGTDGKTLLRIEENMENRDQLLKQLESLVL